MRTKRTIKKGHYNFPVVIEKDDDGYFAFCPTLQGCFTQGETYEQVLKNIEDAIMLHIVDRRGIEKTPVKKKMEGRKNGRKSFSFTSMGNH